MNPAARSRMPDRPVPAGCVVALGGHRHGATGHPAGLSLKNRQISVLHQHFSWCLVPPWAAGEELEGCGFVGVVGCFAGSFGVC